MIAAGAVYRLSLYNCAEFPFDLPRAVMCVGGACYETLTVSFSVHLALPDELERCPCAVERDAQRGSFRFQFSDPLALATFNDISRRGGGAL